MQSMSGGCGRGGGSVVVVTAEGGGSDGGGGGEMGEMEKVGGGGGAGSDGAGAVIWTDLHCPGGSDIIIPLNYLPDKHQGMCCSTIDQSESAWPVFSVLCFAMGSFDLI